MEFKQYPKIHALGSKGFERIFEVPVEISEKIDGSNVSVHKIQGEIRLASRSKWIDHQSPKDVRMFTNFVAWANTYQTWNLEPLPEGSALWGEFSNNHNVLIYEKTCPFILFDVSVTDEFGNRKFLPRSEWNVFFSRYWGSDDVLYEHFNFVQFLLKQHGQINTLEKEFLDDLLQRPSMLGGKMEGVVIKNYTEMGPYGTPLFCKYVSAKFKESHRVSTKCLLKDPIEKQIADSFYNEARLNKGIQKLKELGKYTGTITDIGPLIGVINQDVHEECREEIKEQLFEYHWKLIARIITGKIPQNYKDKIAVLE